MTQSAAIEVGQHWTVHLLGSTLDLDTLISSLVACALILAGAVYLRLRLTEGVPGRFQAMVEWVWGILDDFVQRMVGPFARWAVPLCFLLFFYILICNELELIPTGDRLSSATSDVNQTAALAVIVIFMVHFTSIRQRGLGGYLRINYLHPPGLPKVLYALLVPINVISQISYPISLTLRLFGNIFAAALMLEIIAQLPLWVGWIGNAVWKTFEGAFVDVIQAFIFALLTLIYLSMATTQESHEEAAEAVPA